jgi:MinD superfamily P-loop ATPase
MARHDCRALSKDNEYIFLCSRCGACYVCRHKAVWFDQEEVWKWKCKDGIFRPVINDARLRVGG